MENGAVLQKQALFVAVVNEERIAVPAEDIREVIAVPRLTAVPGGRRNVLGVINYRGEIVPVLDPTAQLTTATWVSKTPKQVAVVSRNHYTFALPVASPGFSADYRPQKAETGTLPERLFKGEVAVGGTLYRILDLDWFIETCEHAEPGV